MPLALVFTSAPRGLSPGRSGYVTVARHEAMPARLVELLESIGTPHESTTGATFTLRALEAGGRRWRILSRFGAGGLDHTRRDNRIAHHLAFAEDEVASLPPPAEIARRWSGWLDGWDGEPAWLPPATLDLRPGRPLVPCTSWRSLTGSGAKAAWLVSAGSPRGRSLSGQDNPDVWLELLAESGALLGLASWEASFTTDSRVTGSAGFIWRCQPKGGELDLAEATRQASPEGADALRASHGITPPKAARPVAKATDETRQPTGASSSGTLLLIIGILGLLLLVGAGWFFLSKQDPAPAPVPVAPAPRGPSAAELESARNLLREQASLGEINECLTRQDVVQAARLWIELERLAPSFAQRNAEPTLARIRSRLASSAAEAAGSLLEQPGTAADVRKVNAIAEDLAEARRIGEAVGAPRDAAWEQLLAMRERALLLARLDIRPTLIVRGRWVTASAGPTVPATADFDLGLDAGTEIRKFLTEGLVGGPGTTARGGIRWVAFRHVAHRDPTAPRLLVASIEPGASSVYVGENTAGGARPGISLTVGSRANVINLYLPSRPTAEFLASCHGLELVNAAGRRLCVALVPENAILETLTLPLAALAAENETQALSPAPWIAPVLEQVRVSGGRSGLFPNGQSFPDRTPPSLASAPNRLDTTLLRLAADGGATMPRAEVLTRQKKAREGDVRGAGAPWTVRAVSIAGEPILTLAEFRD